ncbi:Gfo/Idh/MocA family oxidoreductase [Chryseolinea sp. T2]|uniref:Gfo/Idh/MocA family protein n=1 Tax=Chryseolinea sp. T2 TaxID=3129255 RepID=UPI003076BA51
MLKIGVIGLGDIARKAYLPVLNRKEVEVHLFTRDQVKLRTIASQYRFTHLHDSLASMIEAGIKAAFVHTTTASHEEIVMQLLNNNIHVFVDKPVTYHYESAELLLNFARDKGLILEVGFNRRYAPAIQNLKSLHDVNMVIMQKNRKSLPATTRTFIFDDFIHVVDTLLYLLPYPIDHLIVNGKKKDDVLYHVVVQFIYGNGCTAIGIMNRDSGTNEEQLEVFTSEEKTIVRNVTDTSILKDKSKTETGVSDWEPTLNKRGFEGMVNDFINAVQTGNPGHYEHHLTTHKVCEEIVNRLDAQ